MASITFLKNQSWINLQHGLLQFGILSYILLFPLGQALREICSVISITAVFFYYLGDYKNSNFRRFPYKYLFLFFYCILIFKTFHSVNVPKSLRALDHVSYDSLLLFFPALEFVKHKKDINGLVIAVTALLFYIGGDALYQCIFGHDLFFQMPKFGFMLTATRDDPLLGNLVAIFLPITFSFFYLAPDSWSKLKKTIIYILLTFPAYFFLFFSFRRTGFIAFAFALTMYFLLKRKLLSGLLVLSASFLFFFIGPTRFLFSQIARSLQWEIWKTALVLSKENILFGSGLNTFKAMQIIFKKPVYYAGEYFESTHNLFLGLLVDTGLLGLAVFLLFLFLCLKSIHRSSSALKEYSASASGIVFFFNLSLFAFFIAAIGALDLYSPYMMAPPFIILGTALGSCLALGRHYRINQQACEDNRCKNS
ncbi:MAG: O-antigen ligase family protein [Desulfohalobiaceae bacterium]|nr:O-antigen ligase family protein [Desulfohalobiaceae bacterium]